MSLAEWYNNMVQRSQKQCLRPVCQLEHVHGCALEPCSWGDSIDVIPLSLQSLQPVTLRAARISVGRRQCDQENSPDGASCDVLTPLEPARAAALGIHPMLCDRILVGNAAM